MNPRTTRTLGILLLVLFVAMPVSAGGDEDKEAKGEKSGDDKKEEKTFEAMIEDFDTVEGLFTFYRHDDDDKWYMEITPEQLGTVYMCDVAREAGDGMFFDSGTMASAYPIIFEKTGNNIRLLHKNVYYRADADLPIAGAVERGVTNSVVGTAEIKGPKHEKRGSWLVDPADFFVQDHLGIAEALSSGRAKLSYSFDKSGSRFSFIKSFPMNAEIELVAHYTSKKQIATNMRIPDARSMQHRYRFSLSAIPESDYQPRYADDRVGHFVTQFQDFSSLERDTPYIWYVNRWNLKKSNPEATKSKPQKPIVYWIENTVPHEYRASIREGALLWNQAFDALGFQDAVVVKQMPDNAEWDPSDIRYNTIRWIVMPGGSYAVGPSSANPYTGELYAADIRISADYVRAMFLSYDEQVNPLTNFADVMQLDVPPVASDACSYGSQKAREVAFGGDLLMARGITDTDSEEFRRYLHEAIVDLVAHEVGHTLGMRHNYHASTLHTLEQLNDRERTQKYGLTGSVMDYNPVNIAARGAEQGEFFHTTLGTYDMWAIEYAYTPVAGDPDSQMEQLEAIASRSSEPMLAYGTDEDALGFSPRGIDPVINPWDLSSDPIGYHAQRIALVGEVIGSMEETFANKGGGYQKHRTVFGRSMGAYFTAAAVVPKYLAGFHHNRDHIGDPEGRLPFEPVTVEDQRRALDFLKTHLFSEESFTVPASLTNKLAPERLMDFDWSQYYAPRIDYPLHDVVLNAQRAALSRIYHPILLNRLLDFPLHFEPGSNPLTMHDVFREVGESIWSEVGTAGTINSFRRNLQRAHLRHLIALAVDPPSAPWYSPFRGNEPAGQIRVPEDAMSFARANLVELRASIDSALGDGTVDDETRAHLDESRARIVAALDAQVNRDL